MDETKLILGMSKDLDETVINTRKADLNRIIKYLVRQTYSERNHSECEGWKHLKDLTFWEFLYEVGMFEGNKVLNDYRNEEKEIAKTRYLNAISASVQGNAATILKREVKDIFLNGYNKKIMKLHKAKHDLQICID